MSDTLRYEHFKQLFLGDKQLHIGDRIEIGIDNEWRAGTVQWSREWSAFYIQIDSKTLWMWEGLPVRLAPPASGSPAPK